MVAVKGGLALVLCLFTCLPALAVNSVERFSGGELGTEAEDSSKQAGNSTAAASRSSSGVSAGADAIPPATLHFLFMADAGFALRKYWAHFFSTAPKSSARIWVHCATAQACDRDVEDFQNSLHDVEVTLVPTVPSRYCLDLVSPMAQLANYAADGSHSQTDKFVFVSANTLPVKSFREVQTVLFYSDESHICLHKKQQDKPVSIPGTDFKLLRGTQWAVLNRQHAKRFGRRWEESPELEENRSVTLLLKEGGTADKDLWAHDITCDIDEDQRRENEGTWIRTLCQGCAPTDSVAIFATTIGAIPSQYFPMDEEDWSKLVDFAGPGWKLKCHMASNFLSLPENESESMPALRVRISEFDMEYQGWDYREKHLFRDILEDPFTIAHGHDPAIDHGSHPWAYDAMSKQSFGRLRCSNFLFMRKFADDIDLPFFEEVLDEEDLDTMCGALDMEVNTDLEDGGVSSASPRDSGPAFFSTGLPVLDDMVRRLRR